MPGRQDEIFRGYTMSYYPVSNPLLKLQKTFQVISCGGVWFMVYI